MTDSTSPRPSWTGSPGGSRVQAAKESVSDALAPALGGRRGSDSSSSSSVTSSSNTSSSNTNSSTTPRGLFHTLSTQKRSSTDQNLARRRQSWNEQAVGGPGGFFSKWWDGYLRG
ncbi:hypothetical protein VTN02DRAFT_1816 [Thermoascus thermophilus]